VRLVLIPADKYSDYRYDVIFNAYKWDPQVGDHSTVSEYALLIDRATAAKLETWAEKLSEETIAIEKKLIENPEPAKNLGLPKQIYKALDKLKSYDAEKNVRLMRFDFHPVINSINSIDSVDFIASDGIGWAVSEVNSDVPGGLAEASVMPEIAAKYLGGENNCEPGENTAGQIFRAFENKINKNGAMAFIHATSYSDDRQVMQFLSDYFNKRGVNASPAAPDHIKWINKKAVNIAEGKNYGSDIDGIIRFFPLEWLVSLPKKSGDWRGYYNCETPSCNHPAAVFAQSKRLPLIWDGLGVDIPFWKKLLPETKDPKKHKIIDSDWLYKPALGRVGEGILMRDMPVPAPLGIKNKKPAKFEKIEKYIRRYSENWIMQRKFISRPLQNYHLCIGVFTVNAKRAGFYARISEYALIDAKAKDIPVLIDIEKK
jgi:glutathionylspermidine synthase